MGKSSKITALVLAVLALFGTVMLLIPRIAAENRDKNCAVVFFREDLQMLADANGITDSQFIQQLNAGEIYIIEADGLGYTQDGIPAFAAGVTAELMEDRALNDPGAVLNTVESQSLPLLVIENRYRSSVHAPEGYDPETCQGSVVRGIYLFDWYRNQVKKGDPADVTDLLFLAATDRGLRLLLIRPYGDGQTQEVCTDIEVYRKSFEDLAFRLFHRGLTLGEGFSVMQSKPRNSLLIACAGLLPAMAAVWLACRVKALKKYMTYLLLLAAAADFAVCFIMPAFAQKGLMFASALLLPCVAVCFFADTIKTKLFHSGNFAIQALSLTVGVMACGVITGLSVSALMASKSYMLSSDIFAGVKVSLIAPIALMGVLLVCVLKSDLYPKTVGGRAAVALIAIAALMLAFVMLRRSGDVSRISAVEDFIRRWFEHNVYARPRTKEVFLAVPCIPVFLWAYSNKLAFVELLSGLGLAMEITSVCNTFCHAVTPIRVSVIRTFIGAGIGALIGITACIVLQLIFGRYLKKQNK